MRASLRCLLGVSAICLLAAACGGATETAVRRVPYPVLCPTGSSIPETPTYRVDDASDGCPAPWVTCTRDRDARTREAYIRELERLRDDYATCQEAWREIRLERQSNGDGASGPTHSSGE